MHLGCWAHCRRYYHEALQALPKDKRGPDQLPARFIELIGRLYRVEAEARREGIDASTMKLRRQTQSKPVLDEIETLLLRHLHSTLPGSLLGKALHYMVGLAKSLQAA